MGLARLFNGKLVGETTASRVGAVLAKTPTPRDNAGERLRFAARRECELSAATECVACSLASSTMRRRGSRSGPSPGGDCTLRRRQNNCTDGDRLGRGRLCLCARCGIRLLPEPCSKATRPPTVSAPALNRCCSGAFGYKAGHRGGVGRQQEQASLTAPILERSPIRRIEPLGLGTDRPSLAALKPLKPHRRDVSRTDDRFPVWWDRLRLGSVATSDDAGLASVAVLSVVILLPPLASFPLPIRSTHPLPSVAGAPGEARFMLVI